MAIDFADAIKKCWFDIDYSVEASSNKDGLHQLLGHNSYRKLHFKTDKVQPLLIGVAAAYKCITNVTISYLLIQRSCLEVQISIIIESKLTIYF